MIPCSYFFSCWARDYKLTPTYAGIAIGLGNGQGSILRRVLLHDDDDDDQSIECTVAVVRIGFRFVE